MEREEIAAAIAVGVGRSVCVLLERAAEIPGYVRSVTLCSDNRVRVAFEVEDLDEGGAYFWATYSSLDAALAALERFLGSPVSAWRTPRLEALPDGRVAPDHAAFAAAIGSGSVRLPEGSEFELQGPYWTRFAPDHRSVE